MHTLKVTLKQHTPLIHFQHDQEGATLRASEVKPKLDKYILSKLTPEDRRNGEKSGWIKSKNGNTWLDYKMRIVPFQRDKHREKDKMSLYFGNLNATSKKHPSFYKMIEMTISAIKEELTTLIHNCVIDFFLIHNFGTRQTKGYGSFSVVEINGEDKLGGKPIRDIKPHGYVSFFISDKKDVFSVIGLLHKTLRSGINGPSPYSLYFKSLLFAYADNKGITWDKRSIKYYFLNEETKKEVEKTRMENLNREKDKKGTLPKKSDPTDNENYRHWKKPANDRYGKENLRDYLGFSSNESWMAYDTGVFQLDKDNSAKTNKNGEYVLKKMTVWKSFDKDFKDIGRFKSPIIYKPIQLENESWLVYVFANDDSISALSGKKVYYKTNMPKTHKFDLEMQSSFSVEKFLKESFSLGENVKNSFSVNYKLFDREISTNPINNDNYDTIINVFKELEKNKK